MLTFVIVAQIKIKAAELFDLKVGFGARNNNKTGIQ
jgi:hypothetical protein